MTTPVLEFPVLNIKRLDETLAFIEAHPEAHNQAFFVKPEKKAPAVQIPGNGEICGTTACFAGWTVLLDHEHFALGKDVFGDTWAVVRGTQDRISFYNEAKRLLGLTHMEATDLFYASATLDDVKSTIDRIKAGHYRKFAELPCPCGCNKMLANA